ncbi:carbamoyl phosphate synthase small subunit, partial [Streptomyces kebangsaanensis]
MTTSSQETASQRHRAAPAVLVLEDGRVFRGRAYGAVGETFGEAVFST